MEKDRISYHKSVLTMHEKLKKDGMNTLWDRYEAQGLGGNPDQRCAFCMAGARCDLCSNGPCRADVAKNKKADTLLLASCSALFAYRRCARESTNRG